MGMRIRTESEKAAHAWAMMLLNPKVQGARAKIASGTAQNQIAVSVAADNLLTVLCNADEYADTISQGEHINKMKAA